MNSGTFANEMGLEAVEGIRPHFEPTKNSVIDPRPALAMVLARNLHQEAFWQPLSPLELELHHAPIGLNRWARDELAVRVKQRRSDRGQ